MGALVTTGQILDRALAGRELSATEAEQLFTAQGDDLQRLLDAADHVRRERVGDQVTYVVNRNINFTNVCVKRCGFCAFSRGHRAEEGYFFPVEEVVRRAREAADYGATEVCVQAGLAPRIPGSYYINLCRAIKTALPSIHLHAFSPEEVLYGATLSECTPEDYLARLNDAGLGSLPGTAAEILDDEVRDTISPGRITTAEWIRIIRAAHALGIPTSSTMMFGHIETPRHMARHLVLLREIQKETGGFTEFVPLSFIHQQAPMFAKSLVAGVRPGATQDEVRRVYAVSRLVLQGAIDNVQVSWVKQGPSFAAQCLAAGANDFGGTLMNESISTAAGADHGHFLTPYEMRRWIRAAGRTPAERSTTYRILRTFGESDEMAEPARAPVLESYTQITHSNEFRYRTTARS
jgi:FO synthase subunit 2